MLGKFNSISALTKFQKWQQPSYFKGFNMSVWDNNDDRMVNQQDFDSLKAIGATLVVIQTQGSLQVKPPYGPNIAYQEGDLTIYHIDRLDSMVGFARNAELMYVIAVRDGPGRVDISDDIGTTTIWKNQTEQQLYGQMLKDMAKRYLPDSLFVGMTLTVEPNPMGEMWEPPISELDSALKTNGINLNNLYSLWIDSIRTLDKDLPLIIGGVHANHPEYFSLMSKQADDKIIYVTHLYNPGNFSHEQTANSVTYPDNYWCVRLNENSYFHRTFLKESLYKPVRDFQTTYNVPILIGEFGLRVPQNGGEIYLSDIAGIACEFGWHFAIWGFNNGPEFNYKDLDSIYGTNYWGTVKSFMKCENTDVAEKIGLSESIVLYPNPSNGKVIFESGIVPLSKAEIYNVFGILIHTIIKTNNERSLEINISMFPRGVYFVKTFNKNNIQTLKLILN